MSDLSTEETANTTDANAAPPNEEAATTVQAQEQSKLEDLPPYWQEQFRQLRNEAGSRRVSERDAKTQADAAKDEMTAMREQIAALEKVTGEAAAATTAAENKAAKIQLLAERGLDANKLLRFVDGNSAEEWEQAANTLVELRGENKGPFPDPAQVAAANNTHQVTDDEAAAAAFFGL